MTQFYIIVDAQAIFFVGIVSRRRLLASKLNLQLARIHTTDKEMLSRSLSWFLL